MASQTITDHSSVTGPRLMSDNKNIDSETDAGFISKIDLSYR